MTTAELGDISLYYEQQGEGQPLLFISGTGSDLRNKPNAFDGPLTKSFSVLAYDQRGLGQTSIPDGPYSMAQYAADAAGLLDAVGLGLMPRHGCLLRRHGGPGIRGHLSGSDQSAGPGLHLTGREGRIVLSAA